MSEASAPRKQLIKPIIISNNKKMVIKPPNTLAKVKLPTRAIKQYKDEVIFSCQNCDFLKGESQDVLIVNQLNLLNKSCRTVARCTNRGITVETTSDNVVSTIGQKNYDTLLSALSSVFNEETKVRGILALLSVRKKCNDIATQTTMEITEVIRDHVSVAVQTESEINLFVKDKPRRRMRRPPLTPYVVTDHKIRKCIINPDSVKKEIKKKNTEDEKEKSLPDLKEFLDEDSNISCASNVSVSSWPSLPGSLEHANELLQQIDKVTDKTLNSTGIRLRDGSIIMIPVKPEDEFHIATPEVLKNVTHEERMKLIWHQAFIDFKLCLETNEDGYYPLHLAVLNNDVDLVRRQCASLRARHESVDITVSGLTALHMAVKQNVTINCTNILLQNGADPLLCDSDRRCSLHFAAEQDSAQLRTLLDYCDKHLRRVLQNNEEIWRPELESRSDAELLRHLYNVISEMFDVQGHSPLMAAAEAGVPANVELLAIRAGPLIDALSPDCGATALYRAVAKACLHGKENGNPSVTPEKYLKSIEILVGHGADPSIENNCGSSVNTLVTEFNMSSVSMTIANKMTSLKTGRTGDGLNMILIRRSDGRIGYNENDSNKLETIETTPPVVKTVGIAEKSPRNNSKVSKINKGVNLTPAKDNPGIVVIKNERKLQPIDDRVINPIKQIKIDNVNANVLTDNNSYNDIKTNKFKQLNNGEAHMKNNKGVNMPQIKIGNIIWKAKTDGNINIKDGKKVKIENTNSLKVDLKKNLNANLANVTFKRLSSGQMIAITQTNSEAISPNVDKISLIKFNKNVTDKQTNNTKLETTRHAKERKTDNVVIMENVPIKTFPIHVTPSTSKVGKPKDIVISNKTGRLLNDDIAAKELSMDDISPKIVIGIKDVETVKKFRKRKLGSE